MSKNERTHGDQMATLGELNSLYQVRIFIDKRIIKLETIRNKDSEQKERVNEAR